MPMQFEVMEHTYDPKLVMLLEGVHVGSVAEEERMWGAVVAPAPRRSLTAGAELPTSPRVRTAALIEAGQNSDLRG
jgi:hypothetical protein